MTLRSRLFLVSALLLFGGVARAASNPPPPDDWVRFDTANFSLMGDASERKIREIADELERLKSVLGRLTRVNEVHLTAPTRVYVFRSDEALSPYKPRYGGRPKTIAGWFSATEEENQIAMSARWNEDPRPLIFHEFTHEFLHAALPPAPRWFDEGIAEYYSTFQATDDRARVGRPVEHHVRHLADAGWLSLPRLFAVDHDSPEYNEADKQGIFYAESWAVVHFLLNGDPERTGQLGKLFEATAKGRITEKTFRAITGEGFEEFEGKVRAYVRGGRFPFGAFDLEPREGESVAASTPMSPAATMARLGALLRRSGPARTEEAEAHFRRALALDPHEPVALSGLAALREEDGALVEAAQLHREATRAPGADAVVWYSYGAFLLRSQSGRSFDPGALTPATCQAIEGARAAFHEALRLEPNLAIARARLGSTYFYELPGRMGPGIAALAEAVRRLPHRRDLVELLEDLRKREREGLRASSSDDTRRASKGLDRSENASAADDRRVDPVKPLNDLLARKKWDAAEALLKKEIRQSSGDERVFWQDQYDQIRPLLAKNRLVERYNLGVSYLNRQRFEEALVELRAVAESKDGGSLSTTALGLVREIEELLAKRAGTKGK